MLVTSIFSFSQNVFLFPLWLSLTANDYKCNKLFCWNGIPIDAYFYTNFTFLHKFYIITAISTFDLEVSPWPYLNKCLKFQICSWCRLIDCMVFNVAFNSISIILRQSVQLSMLSWSSSNQCYAQYSVQATGCFPTKPLSQQRSALRDWKCLTYHVEYEACLLLCGLWSCSSICIREGQWRPRQRLLGLQANRPVQCRMQDNHLSEWRSIIFFFVYSILFSWILDALSVFHRWYMSSEAGGWAKTESDMDRLALPSLLKTKTIPLFPTMFSTKSDNCTHIGPYFWHHIFFCSWIGRVQNWHMR